MYVATQDINSYLKGKIKKGDQVEFNQTFLDAGLIAEVDKKPETKPEVNAQVETKPHKQKKKGHK